MQIPFSIAIAKKIRQIKVDYIITVALAVRLKS